MNHTYARVASLVQSIEIASTMALGLGRFREFASGRPEVSRWAGRAQPPIQGGAEGIRTPDPLDANEVRYQLRYSPLERSTQ